MKKLIRVLCSLFFVTTMVLPADAAVNPAEELDDPGGESAVEPSTPENFQRAFLSGDFGLNLARVAKASQPETLFMFINAPGGGIIRDARVVTTIIDQNGRQEMRRANPYKGGFLVFTDHLQPGPYRLEAEIVTNGWLLTDEFHFQKA